jgi:DNA-binding NtrC family response regulator
VLVLADHFLRQFATTMNKHIDQITPAAQQKLLAHHWPGNVRELRNAIERAVILEPTREIQARSLPDFQIETRLRKGELPTVSAGQSLDEIMAGCERDLIMQTLDHNRYNLTRTADQLKISRHALRYRMQRLSISAEVEEEEIVVPGKEVPSC